MLRPARKSDAEELAALIDLAGEGLPSWLWSTMDPGTSPLQTGAARAAREEGGFSYRHAVCLEEDGKLTGMLLGYPLGEGEETDLDGLPAPVRPLVELEALAPGTWYVNAVAVFAEYRGRGLGRLLMEKAAEQAAAAGQPRLSLIVAAENTPALTLYQRLGYKTVARRPLVPWPEAPHSGDWLLLVKEPG